MKFLAVVGTLRPSAVANGHRIQASLASVVGNTNRDVVPAAAWRTFALPAMAASGVTTRSLATAMGTAYNGTATRRSNLSRERVERLAAAIHSTELAALATSDVYWDAVVSITAHGVEDVFDLTVEGLHNFVAGDVIVHNSIEQDADVVLFLYREGMHNREIDRSKTDLIVAKNRNGPIADLSLVFIDNQTAFREPYLESE